MDDRDRDLKINTLENNHKAMSEKLDDLKNIVVNGFAKQDDRFEQFVKKVDEYNKNHEIESDKRYAFKRIEKNVDNLSWLVISSVVLALLVLIIK